MTWSGDCWLSRGGVDGRDETLPTCSVSGGPWGWRQDWRTNTSEPLSEAAQLLRGMGRTKVKTGATHSWAPSCSSPSDDSSTHVSVSCVPPTGYMLPQDKLDLILQDIRESRLTIKQLMGAITTEVSVLKDEHRKFVDRDKTNETTISILEPANEVHAMQISKLMEQL
ncbi:hypothetical protein NDU88_004737 [Pleurodeles waltl]|uniref:Uncharacterized protein n=1 Tax=Pleurodeles waltl TaxID=8319 RepID=A0AAV7V287_PLEWA|nr:hypothetical protein NDU88_004737 [Pleurodeles waltl]